MTTPAEGAPTGPARWWERGIGRWAILGSLFLIFAGAAWWGARQDSRTPRGPHSELLRPAAVALSPGVYLLGKMAPAAVYAVRTSTGLVLIDSGLEADARGVREQLAELGLEVHKLQAILLTHGHADHALGAAYLRAKTGAKVYASRGDCESLRTGRPREAFFSTYHMPQIATHPTPVDVELTGGETLEFGDTRISVLASPGHTPGSICYLVEQPGTRALFTGDVIQHLGRLSPGSLGTYAAHLPPLYRGHAADYLATLRRLRELPVPDLVLPGHPRMDALPQSPRLGEARWRELLDVGIAELETLLARFETDGADFLDGTPRELLSGLYYLGDLRSRSVYALADKESLVLVDAPGGDTLLEFLASRRRSLGLQDRKIVAVVLTSCEDEAISGLAALQRQTGCRVVAPAAGLDEVRRRCSPGAEVLAAEELERSGWARAGLPEGKPWEESVRVLALGGRGRAPVAYQISWAGKTVLVSGRIPVKPGGPVSEELLRELARPGGDARQYLAALERLARVRPELWLPAVPVHGQNANLYDQDWARVLEQNRRLLSW